MNGSNESITLDSVTPIDADAQDSRVVVGSPRPADGAHDHLAGSDGLSASSGSIPELPGIKPLRGFMGSARNPNHSPRPAADRTEVDSRRCGRRTRFTIRCHDRFGNHYSLTEPYAVVICRPDPAPCPEGRRQSGSGVNNGAWHRYSRVATMASAIFASSGPVCCDARRMSGQMLLTTVASSRAIGSPLARSIALRAARASRRSSDSARSSFELGVTSPGGLDRR